MADIDVNGVRLHVDIAGSGPALVFVHGMCGRGAVWAGQVARLSDAFTCVTYDRRGHGQSSDAATPHTVELHGDDFAALVDHLGLAPVMLVGSSGGARIGVDVVLRHAPLLVGAVLSEPPILSLAPADGAKFLATVIPAVQPNLEAGDLRGAVDAFFEIVCPGLWHRLDDASKEPYRQNGAMLVADHRQPPYVVTPEALRQVRMPILAIAGQDSNAFLKTTPKIIASTVPGAEFAEIAGSGHVTYAEQPDVFADLVRGFAGRVFGASGQDATLDTDHVLHH